MANAREVAMRWASLPEGPGKGLGQVCWALRYLGRREVVSPTPGQASHFAAAAFIGGCWIFCLIKLSSKSLWSQRVAGPWQPTGLLSGLGERGQLGEPDKPSFFRLKHSQNQNLKHPPSLSRLPMSSAWYNVPYMSSGAKAGS